MKHVVFFFLVLSYSLGIYNSYSQSGKKNDSINHTDSLSRKQGLWIENDGLQEINYIDDLKNGVFRSYSRKTGKIECFGEYLRDKPIGRWFYFDEKSRLILVQKNISENKSIKVRNAAKESIILPYKSYVEIYGTNGRVVREGLALYDESIEIDFYMFGVWKYFDKNGVLFKEENYKEGRISP
jgi:antitoxin component YwqK of YwqJK toxin-antitoxin module